MKVSGRPLISAVNRYREDVQPSRWRVSQCIPDLELDPPPRECGLQSPISMSEEKCLYFERAIVGPFFEPVWKVRSGLPGVIWEFSTKIVWVPVIS